ncbi:MAG: hypothetical protein ACOC58_03880 [Chloroflexota bacterium]
MAAKVYLLLEIKDGRCGWAVDMLRRQGGVMLADLLEGPPDVVAVIQARNRQSLAQLTVQALASVEEVTEDMQLLPSTATETVRVQGPALQLHAAAQAPCRWARPATGEWCLSRNVEP